MYKNIKSNVFHDGMKSESFLSMNGVRQGENMSPILFALFLNDLQSFLSNHGAVGVELQNHNNTNQWLKLMILLYADDTIIVSSDATDFQNSLNEFNRYCNIWHLKVNVNKTKAVVFGARKTQNFNFKMGTDTIEITKQYHYLGLTFSSNGSFLNARKHVVQQANKALHLLYTRVNNSDLPIDLVIKLFDHTVLPILTYGSEIFGFENIEILEKVHNDFLRKITKSRKSTPMNFLYGELGRYPISIIVQTRMIQFWNRMIVGKESKISLSIYKFMYNHQTYDFKWLNKIKQILNTVGRPDLWTHQNHMQQSNIGSFVKQTLIDQFKQLWHEQLSNTNKGRMYLEFKQEANFEKYLTQLTPREYLNILKFRTANNYLPVESGRHNGIPFEDRLCPLCNADAIGSEKHYLAFCTFFNHERQKYLGVDTLNTINRLGMKYYLAEAPSDVLKNVSLFVSKIMNSFKR